jgi:hypothetical protein
VPLGLYIVPYPCPLMEGRGGRGAAVQVQVQAQRERWTFGPAAADAPAGPAAMRHADMGTGERLGTGTAPPAGPQTTEPSPRTQSGGKGSGGSTSCCWCPDFISLTLSHTHTHTLTHLLTHSLTHTHTHTLSRFLPLSLLTGWVGGSGGRDAAVHLHTD